MALRPVDIQQRAPAIPVCTGDLPLHRLLSAQHAHTHVTLCYSIYKIGPLLLKGAPGLDVYDAEAKSVFSLHMKYVTFFLEDRPTPLCSYKTLSLTSEVPPCKAARTFIYL